MFKHNSNLSGPVILLKRKTSGVYSLRKLTKFAGMLVYPPGSRLESYYPRFNVNMIGLIHHFAREMNIFLCGPTIPWTGSSK